MFAESRSLPPDSDPRDPFQLQRLADELPDDDDSNEGLHDLPAYLPLSHDDSCLSAPIFNVEQFLQSRAYTSLPDLRLELRNYLAALKEELVQLINDDYEAFISLSTDLRDEGARLDKLKWPLADLKGQTLASKSQLQQLKTEIEDKLRKRSALREEKAFLHLLLKISESVTRLESLLLISSPGNNPSSPPAEALDISTNVRVDDDSYDDRVRGNRAKHLSRVAAEYTQLLYHVSKAQPGKCAFVDEIQWRIDRIKSTLYSDLDHLFATLLSSLLDGKDLTSKTSENDRARLIVDMTECLKTYDVLGLWRDAEDVLRHEVVGKFVKKSIFPNSLSVPRSPIVPHTPFPTHSRSPAPPQTASYYPPRTPYTPFTAFASKENPFVLASTSARFLDETEDPLAGLYNQILKFVDRDLKKIMEIAENVCVKSGSRKKTEMELHLPSRRERGEGFEIMANVIWAEVGRAIMDELGNIVFSAGKTDEFRKHHETTEAFLRSLEMLAPSIHSVEAMRSHNVYTAFQKRWQVHTYFQLRWKDMVGRLEDSLATTKIEPVKDHAPFATSQSSAIWVAISTCWSAEVYIPVLNHRFWRLTLQLLSRYKTWLEASLPPFEPLAKIAAAVAAEKATAQITRSSTPVPPSEATSAETTDADNALLKQFAAAISDIIAVEENVMKLWNEQLIVMLPENLDQSPLVGIHMHEDASGALKEAVSSVVDIIPTLSAQIIAILTRRACDTLLPVRSIPSQFRAMQNKKMPSERSYFIPLAMRPVQVFFGTVAAEIGLGEGLKDRYLKMYATEVFEAAAQRYLSYLSVMKKTEESLRKLKKGKKTGFSLFSGGSSAAAQDEGRDEERIRHQMIIDVDAFGKEAETLGVDIEASQAFRALKEMVNAAWTEGEV